MGHATASLDEITLRRKAAAAKAVATLRAKRAGQLTEIREVISQTTESLSVADLEIVSLYLLTGCEKTDPCYAPGAPVCGRSHYVVIGRKQREVILFHPWTASKFTIPVFSFRPEAPDPSVTMPKIMAAIQRNIELGAQLKREVPQYVGQIRAALAQKATVN
jgi:hypothetical protein